MKISDVDKKMVDNKIISNDIIYYDPIADDRFKIEGLAFFESEKRYHRLSKESKGNVREVVYWLASHPSGGQIRFITNAKKIYVNVKNTGDYMMCHMPKTSQQGVDLYFKRKQDKKYQFFTCAKFNVPCNEYESIVFEADNKEEKQIIINLPLYEGLDKILIGIESDAYIKKAKDKKNKEKIVVYGTSVTQGGCASRPGMAYYNILSRWLDIEIINLGFSGNGKGEDMIVDYMAGLTMSAFVSDYDHNAPSIAHLANTHLNMYQKIRAFHPDIPYIMISRPDMDSCNQNELADRRKVILDTYHYACAQGDSNVWFIDGSSIFRGPYEELCTVDGVHPNDMGFAMMADAIGSVLKRAFSKYWDNL